MLVTLCKLLAEGSVRVVGAISYVVDVWRRALVETPIDVVLNHNHNNLCDIRAFELLLLAEAPGTGALNAAPFYTSLLMARNCLHRSAPLPRS